MHTFTDIFGSQHVKYIRDLWSHLGQDCKLSSQWSAHQAAAPARCCVHDNTITLRSSSNTDDLIRFLQQRQASGSIKLFFYAPFTTTSVSTSSTRCEATDIIYVAFNLQLTQLLMEYSFMHILYNGDNFIICISLLRRTQKLSVLECTVNSKMYRMWKKYHQ